MKKNNTEKTTKSKKKLDKDEDMKYTRSLEPDEMRQLDEASFKNQLLEKESELLYLQANLLDVQSKLMAEKAINRRYMAVAEKKKLDDFKKSHKKFTEELKEKYDIKEEHWGYDPRTGVLL